MDIYNNLNIAGGFFIWASWKNYIIYKDEITADKQVPDQEGVSELHFGISAFGNDLRIGWQREPAQRGDDFPAPFFAGQPRHAIQRPFVVDGDQYELDALELFPVDGHAQHDAFKGLRSVAAVPHGHVGRPFDFTITLMDQIDRDLVGGPVLVNEIA